MVKKIVLGCALVMMSLPGFCFSQDLDVAGDITSTSGSFNRYNVYHSATDQEFSLTSLSSLSGLHNGGFGFSNDTKFYQFWVFETAKSGAVSIREEGMGLGTYNADYPIHVYGSNFGVFQEARIHVQNAHSGAPVLREMFSLENNGGTVFSMTDNSLGSTWKFSSNSIGDFNITLDGTGGSEFTVGKDGRVRMGPGSANNFDLRPNGNLYLAGTLYQSSDRNLKKDFKSVQFADVLTKIEEMPITTWQFKTDSPDVRHLGPTAQDFYAAFELGNSETKIAPVDGIGVAFAGIKALSQKITNKDRQIDTLIKQVETQQKRLADQAKMMADQQELLESQREALASVANRLEQLEVQPASHRSEQF